MHLLGVGFRIHWAPQSLFRFGLPDLRFLVGLGRARGLWLRMPEEIAHDPLEGGIILRFFAFITVIHGSILTGFRDSLPR